MKVLFIGKRFNTNRDALQEKFGRIYQLPLNWSLAGIDIELWLIDYHSRTTIRRQDNVLPIISTPVFSLKCGILTAKNVFLQHKYTHVIASGDCYIGYLGYLIAKRQKAKFIFDVYDKYDDFSGYRRPFGIDLFPFLLKRANHCLFASQALKEQIGTRNGENLVVANGLESSHFRPLDLNQCRRKLKLPLDATFIGYFGSMEPDRGVADLADAVSRLREQGSPIELLIGGKPDPSFNLDRPGIRYQGNVPFQQMPLMLGACNLLAIPYRRSALMDAGASNKIAEAIACQRPIVATKTPNLLANFPAAADQIKHCLAEPGDSAEIASAIQQQLLHPVISHLPSTWEWSNIAQHTADQLDLNTPR